MNIKDQLKAFFNPDNLSPLEYILTVIGSILFILIASWGG